MNCEQTKEWLLAYLDGQVNERQRAEIEAHLAGCPACAAEREALAALRADLSATVGAAGAAIQLPPAAETRIAQRLEAELKKAQRPGLLARFGAWLGGPGLVLGGALAAVLVLACVGAILLRVSSFGSTPEPEVIAETIVVKATAGPMATRPAEPTQAPMVVVEVTMVSEEQTVIETVEVEKEVAATPPPAATMTPQPMMPPAPQAEPPGEVGAPAPTPTPAPPDDQTYYDMFFKNYGVNPFIDTEDDHFSTFALDVDTGSYSIARRYVEEGHLPPEDAVRIEEFVNYFEQGYAYPSARETFAIHLDGAPAPFTETDRYRMVRVGIQGYDVPPQERADMALTFVIDVSGSMEEGGRLELVKHALELLVEQLRPGDTVGIVAYTDYAYVVLEPTSGADQEAILRAIYSLYPQSSTNVEAGLRLGYDMANRAYDRRAVNRVVLCSDGVANVGHTGPGSILEVIGDRAREGITLTAIGVGMGNYNDVLLEQLADQGDGFYAYVDDLDEAERLFLDDLTGTLQTIALDAKVQVEFNPEVVSRYRLLGFENRAVADEQFRDDSVDAGEIGAGHSVTALYEVKLHPEAEGRMATVHLRWEEPETGEVIEISRDLWTDDLAESFTAAAPYFQNAVVVAEYAEVLRGSYWAGGNTLAGVLEEAERVAELLPGDPDVAEFLDLVRQASRISRRR
jgi:Ca-activated chloride channel family protein